MATIVLTAVGSAIGGPLGGLVGSFLGASLDRAVFGGAGKRSGPRVSDLAVQSSAYGEPVPRLYGRMRAAGNLIWSPGIKETASSGGGKRRSGTSYTYSASFAVALAARPIIGIARIWADGKLLRNGAGEWIYPATMRLYRGGDQQSADPLIVATEGAGRAPAYRGLAYAVFDDLPLADYGNRIPNLTFEIVADEADPDIGAIAIDLGTAAQVVPPAALGSFPTVRGFAAAHSGSLRSHLEPLIALADLSFADTADGLSMRSGAVPEAVALADRDLGAANAADPDAVERRELRGAGDTLPDSLAIGFFDPSRDYQLGLQRALRRSPALRAEQRDMPVVLEAAEAKALAETLISSAVAARTTVELRLPWRHAAVGVGDTVCLGSDAMPWRVRSRMIEAMVIRLSAERLPVAPRGQSGSTAAADGGRGLISDDAPNGATLLQVMDLPPLPGAVPTTPRLWLAAAGTGAAWRRAEIEVSLDEGNSYHRLVAVAAATTMGVVADSTAAGAHDRWDLVNSIEVQLANDAMWLESRSEAAVLGGANLALVGNEIVQFTTATPMGPRRFRLTGLLRGRRGSESSIAGHGGNERFVLLDGDTLVPFDPPVDALGRTLRFRAGTFGPEKAIAAISLRGHALRPLSPTHVKLVADPGGTVHASWVRRSRGGFAWIDGVDSPVAEEQEAYAVAVLLGSTVVRTAVTAVPSWDYLADERIADGTGGAVGLTIEISQLGSQVGQGEPARESIDLQTV